MKTRGGTRTVREDDDEVEDEDEYKEDEYDDEGEG